MAPSWESFGGMCPSAVGLVGEARRYRMPGGLCFLRRFGPGICRPRYFRSQDAGISGVARQATPSWSGGSRPGTHAQGMPFPSVQPTAQARSITCEYLSHRAETVGMKAADLNA